MRLASFVRDRRRETVLTRNPVFPLPHYSWDWDDVHFVQLNLFPGYTSDPNCSEPPLWCDPMASLYFLQEDLALNVGNSGRPVVLVHHYSAEWWVPLSWFQTHTDYNNVIAPYNVIGIFTGHLHKHATTPVTTRADRRRRRLVRSEQWPRHVPSVRGQARRVHGSRDQRHANEIDASHRLRHLRGMLDAGL